MRNNLAVLMILGFACLSSAETTATMAEEPETPPSFDWAISAGGTLHDKTRGIAVDPAGNILLTGEFTGTATFGEQTLTAVGAMDFFVAKVDPRGKFLWVRSGGGDLIDRGYAVASDHVGNCYVTGHFQSPEAKFDPLTIKTAGDYDIFVAKYDSQGKLAWLKSGGGTGYDYGHGIAADKLGNVFVIHDRGIDGVLKEGAVDGLPALHFLLDCFAEFGCWHELTIPKFDFCTLGGQGHRFLGVAGFFGTLVLRGPRSKPVSGR